MVHFSLCFPSEAAPSSTPSPALTTTLPKLICGFPHLPSPWMAHSLPPCNYYVHMPDTHADLFCSDLSPGNCFLRLRAPHIKPNRVALSPLMPPSPPHSNSSVETTSSQVSPLQTADLSNLGWSSLILSTPALLVIPQKPVPFPALEAHLLPSRHLDWVRFLCQLKNQRVRRILSSIGSSRRNFSAADSGQRSR